MGAGKQGMVGWRLNLDASRLNLARHTFCAEESIKSNWSKNPCPFPFFCLFLSSSPCLHTGGKKAEEPVSPVPIDQVCLDKQGQFFTLSPAANIIQQASNAQLQLAK